MSASIVLGGGCFWCLEAAYQQIKGVKSVISGYAGGTTVSPTYHDHADHAEVVKVTFDQSSISLTDILDVFWVIHDPTTLNRQGADIGTQYRSIILYTDGEQQNIAQKSIDHAKTLFEDPIVTQLQALTNFYPAEDYHQDYFNQNPESSYCTYVINPKLQKLRAKFAAKLR